MNNAGNSTAEARRHISLNRLAYAVALALGLALATSAVAQDAAAQPDRPWIQLFNGRDIKDWIVKINHHDVGDNFGDTFRVVDGVLQGRYDKYGNFHEQFGHLYYKQPFSHYRLAVEYRFAGDLCRGAPEFARLNSGMLIHAQDPRKILKDQNWPIAIEVQFLAGLGDGKPRGAGNMCSPGTHVWYDGKLATQHIIESSAPTFTPGEWVRAEAIVHGGDSITHLINGKKVLEYSRPQIGGDVVEGCDPAEFVEGKPLTQGYVALQAEGQPVDFRKVEIQILDEPSASAAGR